MGAALGRRNDVHKRLGARLIAVTPTDGDIDLEITVDVGWLHVSCVIKHGDGLGKPIGAAKSNHVRDGMVGCKKLTELRDTALVQIGLLHDIWAADRKSTRLNSSHLVNLVCRLLLEKKKQK